ncbi:4-hydroxyproline epimerase [Anatilimnocola aggregata]|uniref:4-hydroxyproline epimerase n=1 Tax=Anatilimnocola aggregata TaxID=2528021 RepID=A0A517YK55_9BACT|nr:proline racemase family protein [Anatilimnocola aggregata]QDU30608.1 4-hydroxyproline epimerase [Anatilimnocola aggregata]
MQRIQVIDSHTGGEPTRVVISGGPQLGSGTLAERRERFRAEFDHFRRAIICEPRGSDVIVGALLCPPVDPTCAAGVIFFNNVGYLGMCGHGTIGLAVTLGHLGRISAGCHRLETPVGQIPFEYDGRNTVSLENIASFRLAANVQVAVEGLGEVSGDIAWGGNWFFLVRDWPEPISPANAAKLTDIAQKIKAALRQHGITGTGGAEIDHIELFGLPSEPGNHSRNFVLCPGGAYDRSPCGTGTSAKIACLAADGKLAPGKVWRQEGILGSVFSATYRLHEGSILPRIAGEAYLTASAELLIDEGDSLAWGLRS